MNEVVSAAEEPRPVLWASDSFTPKSLKREDEEMLVEEEDGAE